MSTWSRAPWAMGLGLFLGSQPAHAGAFADARACVRRADLECAKRAQDDVSASSTEGLKIEVLVAFYEGRYADSVAALDTL